MSFQPYTVWPPSKQMSSVYRTVFLRTIYGILHISLGFVALFKKLLCDIRVTFGYLEVIHGRFRSRKTFSVNAPDRGKNREYEKWHKWFFTSKKYIFRRYPLFFDGKILLRGTKGIPWIFQTPYFFRDCSIVLIGSQALALLMYKISLIGNNFINKKFL